MLQVAHQRKEAGCRFEAEFGTEEFAVAREGPQCLRLVPFGQVHTDEGGVGAFAQRFRAHGGDGCRRCIAEAPGNDEVPGKRFEGVEPELPPLFRFDDSPVVVPVGEEVGGKAGNRGRGQVALLELRTLQEQAVRGRAGVVEVDVDTISEADVGKRRDDGVAGRLRQTGERGAKAGVGPGVGGVGPEGLGDQGAGKRPLAEGEEGEQPLRGAGNWSQEALTA